MLISGGSKFNANTGSFLGAIQQSIQYILGIATAGIALGFTLWKTYLKFDLIRAYQANLNFFL